MAGTPIRSRLIFLSIFIFLSINTVFPVDGTTNATFGKLLNPAKMGLKKEKLSHFRIYWHDVASGPKPTAVRIAEAPSTSKSPTLFGATVMIDDPLTEGPELSSKLLGRAQGFYASAAQTDVAYLVAMNFAFSTGKYNGSSISIFGRNPVLSKVREMPIIGGSGLFRFARGYVQFHTVNYNLKTGDATNEYNIYVFHY
ncbi:hypothetical protein MKW94_003705 [Papaver nudicaule]|uniref:Dirigent protein n=1 Tax=Papaver nudicaule TaxID=74823 RepID=A0AA41RVB3_PAPNU|nr:hypothetical protein [Papaver nudicaule]